MQGTQLALENWEVWCSWCQETSFLLVTTYPEVILPLLPHFPSLSTPITAHDHHHCHITAGVKAPSPRRHHHRSPASLHSACCPYCSRQEGKRLLGRAAPSQMGSLSSTPPLTCVSTLSPYTSRPSLSRHPAPSFDFSHSFCSRNWIPGIASPKPS